MFSLGGKWDSQELTWQTRMFEFCINNLFNSAIKYTKNIQRGEKDFKHKEHFHHKFNTEHPERPSQHHTAMPYVYTSYFWPQHRHSLRHSHQDRGPSTDSSGKNLSKQLFLHPFSVTWSILERFAFLLTGKLSQGLPQLLDARRFFLKTQQKGESWSKPPWCLYHWEIETAWDSPALVHGWRNLNAPFLWKGKLADIHRSFYGESTGSWE